MNLLYTLMAYPPSTGGAQLYLHLLAQQMYDHHDIQVVSQWDEHRTDWLLGTTLFAPGRHHRYTIDGVSVHRLGLSVWEKLCLAPYVPIYYPLMQVALPPIATCLARHLSPYAIRADLVHNVRAGREGLSYASFQVARQRDIPFVLTPVHHPRWVGWRYRAYIVLYRMADLVLALTDAEKQILIELGVREERIAITGMGPVVAEQVDAEAFRHRHAIGDAPMVLFLGQHYRYKGYQQVLQAARRVWQRVPEVHFVFIGPPVGQSERVFQAFPDQRIHRLGRVDLYEKSSALAACTLLCVPSMQESFGGVYTEAWSFGKPVIGGRIPAVSDVIADGRDGYLVDQQPAQIADHICDLVLNPTRAQQMGTAGQHKLQERYTWQQIARRTEQAYQQVVAGRAV